ncbi:NAD-dependent dehydratase [Candidatus Daviesbacteria bacterium RIFCSPHIGHO2_01_FULL_36_37]|uniref:NAD-dependent dehydratase n=1 Tax=Candidatus Daviesbacteria bacterium RIFCSPHIGHO2_01_FULL_36_37 TaxID=1797758 RepID=A0A1F5IK72_9BACT|nr:MAG: NAD-dependent dehydratase [Candidatus Daviesbacteria bacterium RIFCSPHIGHO2_01_FULL_36_37]
MKIVVTGGAGFLGSHLCDRLINSGHEVVALDNLSTGSKENIMHLLDNPNFEFIQIDLSEKLPEDLKAAQIYHLASPASPNEDSPKSYHKLAFETMQVNTLGTWNMCELAQKLGAKILFTSTSEIYGEPLEHPQKESYRGNVSTTGPRSVYDESKRFGETIVAAFERSKDVDGRIVRIFNTYGPRMDEDDGRVVVEFITAALEKKPFPIFGDGQQTRSFCFVSDLIEGLVLAMNTEDTRGEVINLGNPDEYTIKELAQKIKELTESESEMVFEGERPEDDPSQRCPDISKAKELLGWEPKVPIDEGLEETIKYFRN